MNTMIDAFGNTIQNGQTVRIVIKQMPDRKAIFKSESNGLATVQMLGVKFRKGGLEGYSEQVLSKYVYAIKEDAI